MSSDSEIDDLQRFEESRQNDLSARAGIGRNQFEDEEVSDEEVLGIGSDNDDLSEDEQGQEGYYEQDDETVKQRRDRTNHEQDDNWGNTRDNYFGGEDDIGADEGASDEEEEEALRLQQKELDEMAESDFVDEDNLESWKKDADNLDLEAPQEAATFDPSTMTATERRELIEEKFPAVALLTEELGKCQSWEEELKSVSDSRPAEIIDIGKTALNTYKGMIYSFFSLFTDRLQKGDMQGLSQLDEHPVNEGLLMARQMWYNYQQTKWDSNGSTSSAISTAQPTASDEGVLGDESEAESEAESTHTGRMEDFDEDTDLSEFGDSENEKSQDDNEDEDEDEFSIAKPQAGTDRDSLRRKQKSVIGDFDETADTIEQQARAKNKQSLRFYTSQIGKGDIKKHDAYSGDIDLPYRERDFERRQRLMAEAQKRGRQEKDQLGGNDYEMDEEAFGDDGSEASGSVYSEMKNQRDAAKNIKHQRHAEAIEAARAGRIAEYLSENPNVDKRAINYQIAKNKGLTPRRKKENRNARVKKRVRYEAAQKKLKGVRKVYKGAEGPYQGELTGIRKNLTHSTRFKN